MTKSSEIRNPTYYVEALLGQFSQFAFDEERAQQFRGKWREMAFLSDPLLPLDLEIGTGNGFFFSHRATLHPERLLLGLEIKFKPLIQAIRRALNSGCRNARAARFNAKFVSKLFEPGELNNVFIHHPDPWSKKSKAKRRLMQVEFLKELYELQRPQSFLDFKTDSKEYFLWAIEQFKKSPYEIERYTESLHESEWAAENFKTHFENIFLQKGQPIYYARAVKK